MLITRRRLHSTSRSLAAMVAQVLAPGQLELLGVRQQRAVADLADVGVQQVDGGRGRVGQIELELSRLSTSSSPRPRRPAAVVVDRVRGSRSRSISLGRCRTAGAIAPCIESAARALALEGSGFAAHALPRSRS